MLTRADAGGQTPYDWLARAIPPDVSRVLDIGCGSGVMGRLRSVPQFPGGSELTGLKESLEGNGFRLLEAARERFAFAVHGRPDADLIVGSLYLPGTADRRRDAAAAYLAQRAGETDGPVDVPIPIRRVVAVRRDTP